MEYVTTILEQLAGVVEKTRLRSEAFQRAGGMPGLVALLRSVDQTPDIHDLIQAARSTQDWIGAVPFHEPVASSIPAPTDAAVAVIGIDGSQVYPSSDHPVVWAYVHAASWGGEAPIWASQFFGEDVLLDESGYLIPGHVIDAWRALSEARVLRQVLDRPWSARAIPLIDGSLLPWQWDGHLVARAAAEYRECIVAGRGRMMAGVSSSPASRHLIHLLRLVAGEAGQSRSFVKHIHDRDLACHLLSVGHRSAIFKLGSPQNAAFEHRGATICMFYLRTSSDEVLRIEVPIWVAQDPDAVRLVHAGILADSQGLAYPASLACAHHRVAIAPGLADELHKKALSMYVRRGGSPSFPSAKMRAKGRP